jgi:hypothetical protein
MIEHADRVKLRLFIGQRGVILGNGRKSRWRKSILQWKLWSMNFGGVDLKLKCC